MIMKKLYLFLCILFSALTFAGAAYALLHRGTVNAGYACVPMTLTLVFSQLAQRSNRKGEDRN